MDIKFTRSWNSNYIKLIAEYNSYRIEKIYYNHIDIDEVEKEFSKEVLFLIKEIEREFKVIE